MLKRKVEAIEELLNGVREIFGVHSIRPYGDCDEPESVGFMIEGIKATFSVLVEDRLAEGAYNIQIESCPPGDYVYADIVSLPSFLELAELVSGPPERWPSLSKPKGRRTD